MAMPDCIHAYALQLLGAPPFERWWGTGSHLGRRKAMGLLAYLAFGKRAYNRDILAAVFWPDHDQVHAQGSLRRLLSDLRRQLGEELMPVAKERIGPLDMKRVRVDIEDFQELLAQGWTRGREQLEAGS